MVGLRLSALRLPLFLPVLPEASLLASWPARLGHMNVSRERFFMFVIAGLDPAIHAGAGLLRLSASFRSLTVSMDHRVKPGGDRRREHQRGRQRNNPVGLRGKLDCFVAVAPRNDAPRDTQALATRYAPLPHRPLPLAPLCRNRIVPMKRITRCPRAFA